MTNLTFVISAFIFLSPKAFAAPANNSHDAKVEAAKTKKDLAEQDVMNANKQKKCTADGECSVLEMGERVCGGPSQYVIVSDSNPKLSIVKAKMKEFTKAERELNLLDSPADCTRSPMQPTGKCEKENCVPSY